MDELMGMDESVGMDELMGMDESFDSDEDDIQTNLDFLEQSRAIKQEEIPIDTNSLHANHFFGIFITEKEYNSLLINLSIKLDTSIYPENSCVALSAEYLTDIIHSTSQFYNITGYDVDWKQTNHIEQWKKLIPVFDLYGNKILLKDNNIIDNPNIRYLYYDRFVQIFSLSILNNIILPFLKKFPAKDFPKKDTKYIVIPFGYNVAPHRGHQLSIIIDLDKLYDKRNIEILSNQSYIFQALHIISRITYFVDNLTHTGESKQTDFFDWLEFTFNKQIKIFNNGRLIMGPFIIFTPIENCATVAMVGRGKKKGGKKKRKKFTKKKKGGTGTPKKRKREKSKSIDSEPSNPDLKLMETQRIDKLATQIQRRIRGRHTRQNRNLTKKRYGTHKKPKTLKESRRRFLDHQRYLRNTNRNRDDGLSEYLQHFYFPHEPTYEFRGRNPNYDFYGDREDYNPDNERVRFNEVENLYDDIM
jgi:hypothetical protein